MNIEGSACHIYKKKNKITKMYAVFAELFLGREVPEHICSDNGPKFVVKKLVKWLKCLKVGPLFIALGSHWANGYCESFNGKMRYKFLDGQIFYSLFKVQALIEKWLTPLQYKMNYTQALMVAHWRRKLYNLTYCLRCKGNLCVGTKIPGGGVVGTGAANKIWRAI